jgi:hypothetical protein
VPALDVTALLEGLDSPRGLAVGPAGRFIYAEGNGSVSELIQQGINAGSTKPIGTVPATYIAPQVATEGGQIFVLTAGGPPGSGSNTLYKLTRGTLLPLADIAAYQETDPDPFNLADPPEESNPFGLAPLPDGSVLVSDAAANDLLRVYPNGHVVTVARLKPRTVPVPAGLPPGFPPAGAMLPSEAVATSVTVGADGFYYVGELRGFPATPGRSQIWRIAPNSVNAGRAVNGRVPPFRGWVHLHCRSRYRPRRQHLRRGTGQGELAAVGARSGRSDRQRVPNRAGRRQDRTGPGRAHPAGGDRG